MSTVQISSFSQRSQILRFYSNEIHSKLSFQKLKFCHTTFDCLHFDNTLLLPNLHLEVRTGERTKKIYRYDTKLSGFVVAARCPARLSRLYYVLNACHGPASTRLCLILKSLASFYFPSSLRFRCAVFRAVRSTFQDLAKVIHVL